MNFWNWLNHWLTVPYMYRTAMDNFAGFCWALILVVIPILSILGLTWLVVRLINNKEKNKRKKKNDEKN